jgi:hypothetical protein
MQEKSENSGVVGLPYTVIRIRAGDPHDVNAVHTGTGFFYSLRVDGGVIQLIVSNKHVLCGKTWIQFDFACSDDQGVRILGPSQKLHLDPGQLPIFEHPDPEIDLAAIPLEPLIGSLRGAGKQPHALLLSKGNFPAPQQQDLLHAATSVLMVGFPNGIMDEANNLPVVRRGTLATPYRADYLGKTNFAVDIAAFGGSSGSPVFALFEHALPDDHGQIKLMAGSQLYLIGVLHSGPTMTAQGTIISRPVPTNLSRGADEPNDSPGILCEGLPD